MKHTDAINIVRGFLPTLQKGASAEDVLLGYAKSNNLAPAKLEKLAQVLNTMRTINFMDRSDTRGDTFEVVDPPGLLTKYAAHTSPGADQAHDRELAQSWFKTKEASSYSGPDLMGAALRKPSAMEKLASYEDEADYEMAPSRQSQRRQQIELLSAKEAKALEIQVAEDLEEEATTYLCRGLLKISRAERSEPGTLQELELDMLGFFDAKAVKEVFDKAAKFIGVQTIKRASDVTDSRRLARDRHNFQTNMSELVDNLQLLKNAQAFKAATANTGTVDEIETGHESGPGRSNRENVEAAPSGPGADPAATAALLRMLSPPPPSGPGAGLTAWSGMNNKFEGSDDVVLDLLAKLGPSSNRRQEKLDAAAEEVRQVTNIERLMATDDVLSQANPAEVLSLYNTLRTDTPTIANDINKLKLALREAVSYDGLTPDAMKTLGEIQFTRDRSNQLHGALKKDRYGIAPVR